MNLIDELKWRGLIQDITPDTAEYLANHKVKGYVGFDPTADSLHIGNLVPVMLLVHLQRYGHTPVALVGGATGMIGDPSGKSAERQFLSEEILRHNEAAIHAQLARFLTFDSGNNQVEMVNNYDWFKGIGFLEFLREVGKYITVNYMMAKDSVKGRIEKEQGLSYTEFSYQLVQGYDFYWLYKNKGVQLQMGGADQWGNITTGSALIRKKEGSEAKALAFTSPLLTREDGTKFGKTAEGENIWLDVSRTSAYVFYQYWLNLSDADAEKCMKIFSLLPLSEIAQHIETHKTAPHQRSLQKALANEITAYIHGEEGLNKALFITNFMFGGNLSPEILQSLDTNTWNEVATNMEMQDRKTLSRAELEKGTYTLTDLLANTQISSSKGEARKAIQQKAIALNGTKIAESAHLVSLADLFHGKYLLVQSGKKNKYLIEVIDK